MKVTVQEIIETLREMTVRHVSTCDLSKLADRIQQHGIAVEYTPMTDDELIDAYLSDVNAGFRKALQSVQQAVLARKGVAPNHIPDTGKMVLAEDGNCHNCGGVGEYLDGNEVMRQCERCNAQSIMPDHEAAAPDIQERMDLEQAKAICEQAGFAVVPVEPTQRMETAHDMYGDTSDWWNCVLEAAKEVK
jgi:hypothetical protein